jgi:deazaflavin-dependent oxidoreductase (nitroreductase family)
MARDPTPGAIWFRRFNVLMLLMWRLGLGRPINANPRYVGRIMVLTHTGRRSGRRYRTPLNYVESGEFVYCVAGFGRATDWYRNVRARPEVDVWLPGRRFAGVVDEVSDSPERGALIRSVLVASGFAAPAAGVPVRRLDDEQLALATKEYRVLRIKPRPGAPLPESPADLAWVWLPVAAAAAFGVAARRSRRRRATRRAR